MKKIHLIAPLAIVTLSSATIPLVSCNDTQSYRVHIIGSKHARITVTQNIKGKDLLAEVLVTSAHTVQTLKVSSDNGELVQDKDYTYSEGKLDVHSSSLKNNVTIEVVETETKPYTVNIVGAQCTTITITQNERGKDLLADVIINPEHEIEGWKITSGGIELKQDIDYKIQDTKLTIYATSLSAEVTIEVIEADITPYIVNVKGAQGITLTVTQNAKNKNLIADVVLDDGCEISDIIISSGGKTLPKSEYTFKEGVLDINYQQLSTEVTIEIKLAEPYIINIIGANCASIKITQNQKGKDIIASVKVEEDFDGYEITSGNKTLVEDEDYTIKAVVNEGAYILTISNKAITKNEVTIKLVEKDVTPYPIDVEGIEGITVSVIQNVINEDVVANLTIDKGYSYKELVITSGSKTLNPTTDYKIESDGGMVEKLTIYHQYIDETEGLVIQVVPKGTYKVNIMGAQGVIITVQNNVVGEDFTAYATVNTGYHIADWDIHADSTKLKDTDYVYDDAKQTLTIYKSAIAECENITIGVIQRQPYLVNINGIEEATITVTNNQYGQDLEALITFPGDFPFSSDSDLEKRIEIWSNGKQLSIQTNYALKIIFKPNPIRVEIGITVFHSYIDNDVTIKIQPATTPWYEDDEYLESLTLDDVGTVQKVEVNGINHRVRLIDVDKDELADGSGNKAHTTWEFADVISDANGYSLTTFWNDISDAEMREIGYEHPCDDYANSSIRYALTGQGNPLHWGWYEKGASTKSTTYAQPVINMLPESLVQKMKYVIKECNFYDNSNPDNPQWVIKPFTDKLFLLSNGEMWKNYWYSYNNDTYFYYLNYLDWPSNTPCMWRIKRQVAAGTDALTGDTPITDSMAYIEDLQDCVSIAGYNSTSHFEDTEILAGTGYYLRQINTDSQYGSGEKDMPFGGSSKGQICSGFHGDGNFLAAPVAPAFCL